MENEVNISISKKDLQYMISKTENEELFLFTWIVKTGDNQEMKINISTSEK